jgi:hypothetical protein
MRSLRRDMTVIICLKLLLLFGIKTAFFSADDKVHVEGSELNHRFGLPPLHSIDLSKRTSGHG